MIDREERIQLGHWKSGVSMEGEEVSPHAATAAHTADWSGQAASGR